MERSRSAQLATECRAGCSFAVDALRSRLLYSNVLERGGGHAMDYRLLRFTGRFISLAKPVGGFIRTAAGLAVSGSIRRRNRLQVLKVM
jgi:hypothetical protein